MQTSERLKTRWHELQPFDINGLQGPAIERSLAALGRLDAAEKQSVVSEEQWVVVPTFAP